MKFLRLALLAVAGFAFAQDDDDEVTKPFTDPATGIEFQTFTSEKGAKFGVALPQTGSKDLIGYLSAPKGFTYVGGVLGPKMNGTVLLVAWPNGKDMIGSIRKVPDGKSSHAAPPELTTDITLQAIPKGTFIAPSGDWQYTFVCTGCLGRKDVNPATGAKEEFAWALSNIPLKEPGNREGKLNHHHAGSGSFTADLSRARSAKYTEWSKMVAAHSRKIRHIRH